jgi:hypothetical protein
LGSQPRQCITEEEKYFCCGLIQLVTQEELLQFVLYVINYKIKETFIAHTYYSSGLQIIPFALFQN